MSSTTSTAKHPKGLKYLFFAEMWERFGYYLMIGIFVLYMTDTDKGGLGLERANASDIFGTFIALVFLTPFLGGILADRLLGYRTAITIGGILMGLGYCGLAIPGETSFYISMLLIIVGNGFFKPNISTLLGNLYNEPQFKENKDAGYNIFYMGINIGAFICNFFAAYLRNSFGWGYAFIGAGVGMFLGVIIFWIGMKHYRHADVKKPAQPGDTPLSKVLLYVIVPAFAVGIGAWLIPGNIFGTDSTDAFIFGSLPVLLFYVSLYARAEVNEKKPIGAMLAIFAVVIVFWAVFKQNGTALTTYAQYYTDREIPTVVEGAASSLKLVETVSIKKDSVIAFDNQFRKIKDAEGNVVKEIGYEPYLKNVSQQTIQQNDGGELKLVSTELFQSINPFFVVVLTPVVVAFFVFLRRRKKEPSTPAKIAWGLVISGLSTLVMVAAVYVSSNGAVKASPLWLFGCYGVITVGELFLSPMGLSLVSKLSPPRFTALMMGGWFLSTSIGNKLSGILAVLWDGYDNKANYFLVNMILLGAAAIVMFLLLKRLNKVFAEYGGN
ncbi:MAG: peptide MFS transporter [Bacteroidota bacterium]